MSAEMDAEDLRKVFSALRELDVVRLVGEEPLLRPDLIDVAETILELSRPSVLHLATDGQQPRAAEDFARALSSVRPLRIVVQLDAPLEGDAHLEAHRRFATALDTLKVLRTAACERAFEVSACSVLRTEAPGHHVRTRDLLDELGVELYVLPPSLHPGEAWSPAIRNAIEAELERLEPERGLTSAGVRYFLRGALGRLDPAIGGPRRPICTSLRSHFTIEADGSVATCGLRSESVGSLVATEFDELWFGPQAESARGVVEGCSGCWAPEEVLPSAFYTGDIVRALRGRVGVGSGERGRRVVNARLS
ncbi:MAG: SPASM domain-containing protein [Myxococcota bacterium]